MELVNRTSAIKVALAVWAKMFCTNQGFLSDYFLKNILQEDIFMSRYQDHLGNKLVVWVFLLLVQVKNWLAVTMYLVNMDQTTAANCQNTVCNWLKSKNFASLTV